MAAFLLFPFPGISLAQFVFVDLTGVVNNDGLTGLADPDDSLPTNTTLHTLTENTPYQVSENGANKLVIANIEGIDIDIQDFVATFHFVGQIHFGVPNNFDDIGRYVLRYDDGSTLELILNSNSGSSDWNIDDHCCNWRQRDLPMASIAFQEATPQNTKESLLRELVFPNPNPEIFVESIEFVSEGTSVTPVLAAITYEVVPEPSVFALSAVGTLLIVSLRRRFLS